MRYFVFLAALSGILFFSFKSHAQDVAINDDLNSAVPDASEDTALPPIEVIAPSEPLRKTPRKRKRSASSSSAGAIQSSQQSPSDEQDFEGGGDALAAGAGADGEGEGAATGTVEFGSAGAFTLGQLDMIGGSVVSSEAIWKFDKPTLDEAVNLVPGVNGTNLGGRRNERGISIRGFDRFRAPLSIDGVRIYLPADNRLDYGRFLTPDVAEIQIQKGYVSVLNGPGGMGGAINLVTRKPTKALEMEIRSGLDFDGDLSQRNAWNSFGFLGTRQEHFYAQISGTILDQDQWTLSEDFNPTFFENGGDRDNSDKRDWRVNMKVGFTPNKTDEYAISYTKQAGEKNAPLHVRGDVLPRYWQWPTWDVENLSWQSKTQLGAQSYVKTSAYYNTFYNILRSFDDASYTTQFRGYTFDSYYDDYAYGGHIEAGTELIPQNTLKAAVHYRLDNHRERGLFQPNRPGSVFDPWEETEEETWSIAVENTFHATNRLDFVAGVSWDKNDLKLAENYDFRAGQLLQFPTASTDAWNWQGAAIYNYSDSGRVHASVSSRTRFPTISERFSTGFGFALPNPDLNPERATNYEIGWSDTLNNNLRLSSAIFYSDIKDFIQTVGLTPVLSQNQNVGSGESYGIEMSADWDVMKGLRIGGNYTYLERELTDPSQPNLRPEGTPRHKAFMYLAWQPIEKLTLTPSVELASDRWSVVRQANLVPPIGDNYVKTGSYALVNFQAEYQVTDNASLAFGGRNLLDQNYELSEGFPEQGRSFFTSFRARF